MISDSALNLILEFEGIDQPSKWPGGESGVTLGVGYDLGYTTRDEFTRDWRPHLSPAQLARLTRAIGAKGDRARIRARDYRDITIPRTAALAVFQTATLPKWHRETIRAFPAADMLPPDAFGALLSLTFNRGPSMLGDRRREMRAIRDAIIKWATTGAARRRAALRETLATIAAEVRSMKRLWAGRGLDGLIRRREAEARLIERAA